MEKYNYSGDRLNDTMMSILCNGCSLPCGGDRNKKQFTLLRILCGSEEQRGIAE